MDYRQDAIKSFYLKNIKHAAYLPLQKAMLLIK